METLFRTPKAVLQAKETQRGMHLAFEILVFIAVFFVCTIGDGRLFKGQPRSCPLLDREYLIDRTAAG